MLKRLLPVVVGVLVFILFYVALKTKVILPLDESVAQWAISFRDSSISPFLKFITDMYTPSATIAFIVAVIATLIIFKRFKESIYFFTAVFGALIIKSYIKHFVMRPRPPYKIVDIGGYSFPSGHSTLSMAMGIALYFIVKSVSNSKTLSSIYLTIALLWAGFIGFTRLYFGAHWFSDVVSGWLLGFSWAYLMGILFFKESR